MVRSKADVHVAEPQEGLDQQRCARDQHDRERNLDDDECATEPAPPAPHAAGTAFLETGLEIHSPGLERGCQAEPDAGQHGETERHRAHGVVDGDAFLPRQSGGIEREQERHTDRREDQPKHAAYHGQDQTLREELPDQPAAAGTERDADRELPAATLGSHEEKVGDIGTGDDQQEAHRAEQDEKCRPDGADEGVGQRLDAEAEPHVGWICVGILRDEPANQRRQLTLRVDDRDSRPETGDCVEIVRRARLRGRAIDRDRDEDGRIAEGEAAWHHPDHHAWRPVERDFATEDRGVGAEAPLPETIVENDDLILRWPILVRSEEPSERRLDTEHTGKRLRRAHGDDPLGRPHAGEGQLASAVTGDAGEGRDRALEIDQLGLGEVRVGEVDTGEDVVDGDEALGIAVGQRPKQDPLHHREDRGVGSDGERQSDEDRGREPWASCQCAQRVRHVLTEPGAPFSPARRRRAARDDATACLAGALDVPEAP